jgi:DinB superfamily
MSKHEDVLARLADMPRKLRELADRYDGDVRRRPTDTAFSLLEHACHLRDIELLAYERRITRILAEERPELPDVDGGAIAREADYHAHEELEPALLAFAALRTANVAALERLTDEQWARTGVLEGAGEITIADLAGRMAVHDAEHLAELRNL